MSQTEIISETKRVIGIGDGIVEPVNPLPYNPGAPEENLELQAVFGYNGDLYGNLGLNNNGEIVYSAGSVGVM